MSEFIWGKRKFKNESDKSIEDYQEEDIQIFFNMPTFLYSGFLDLTGRELYYNISCGYLEAFDTKKREHYLNCHEQFFSPNFILNDKDNLQEICYLALYGRLKRLQGFIAELFQRPNIEQLIFYYSNSGDDNSTDDYIAVDWKLEEFADKILEEEMESPGGIISFKLVLAKQTMRGINCDEK